jgi:hypothetical protein
MLGEYLTGSFSFQGYFLAGVRPTSRVVANSSDDAMLNVEMGTKTGHSVLSNSRVEGADVVV